jgi:hypothetical protein
MGLSFPLFTITRSKSADWWVRVQTANSWQCTIPLPHKKSKADAMVNSDFVNPYGSTMVNTNSDDNHSLSQYDVH